MAIFGNTRLAKKLGELPANSSEDRVHPSADPSRVAELLAASTDKDGTENGVVSEGKIVKARHEGRLPVPPSVEVQEHAANVAMSGAGVIETTGQVSASPVEITDGWDTAVKTNAIPVEDHRSAAGMTPTEVGSIANQADTIDRQ
jgi:hypothetical protein